MRRADVDTGAIRGPISIDAIGPTDEWEDVWKEGRRRKTFLLPVECCNLTAVRRPRPDGAALSGRPRLSLGNDLDMQRSLRKRNWWATRACWMMRPSRQPRR